MASGKDLNGGTNLISPEGGIMEKEAIAVYNPINAAKASELEVPFKAFLTFAVYNGSFPPGIEYIRHLYNPRTLVNKEKKIIPISYSFDLVKTLKRQEHPLDKDELLGKEYAQKHGPATFNIIRSGNQKIEYGIGIGVLDLYRKLPNPSSNIEDLIINNVSRNQFQIAVPETNKKTISIMGQDTKNTEYPIYQFSGRYKDSRLKISEDIGVVPLIIEKGEAFNIAQENLGNIADKIVIGFGSYLGKGDARRFLMYITPNEMVPKL